jgi:hypothetical protein
MSDRQLIGFHTEDSPRGRYAAAVLRACENGDLPLVRCLFAEANAELGHLQGLLSTDVEIELGRLLTPKYQAGAGLLLLADETGRTPQYVAKVLRLAGVTIRPPFRPVMAVCPVDLVELRRRYESGSTISSLAHVIHYSKDQTRAYLLRAGAELRPRHPRPSGGAAVQVASAPGDQPGDQKRRPSASRANCRS